MIIMKNKLKLYVWTGFVDYGYGIIAVLAYSKQQAIDVVQRAQDREQAYNIKYSIKEKEYRKACKIYGERSKKAIKLYKELHKLRKKHSFVWYADELKYMKKYKPRVIQLNKPKIVEINSYEE